MIRRRSDNGYVLISQAEHARIAADIALHIGGAFQPASDPANLTAALRLHSAGFAHLDAVPPLCAAGRPANFDELSLMTLLDAWAESSELALATGAYAAMMISLLCLQRTAAVSSGARTLRENFQINKVQHRQIEIQEQLRPQLGLRSELPIRYGLPDSPLDLNEAESQFFHDYRLMLFCIQLALELCAHRNLLGRLASTPPAPGRGAIAVAYRMVSSSQCILSPFPLASPLTLAIKGRRVPATVYDHERELHQALAIAERTSLDVVIQP